MKLKTAVLLLIILAVTALPAILRAQGSSAMPGIGGFLSIATTGSAACPHGQVGACWIAYGINNPIPTVTVSP